MEAILVNQCSRERTIWLAVMLPVIINRPMGIRCTDAGSIAETAQPAQTPGPMPFPDADGRQTIGLHGNFSAPVAGSPTFQSL